MEAIEQLAHRAAIDPRIRAEAVAAIGGTTWRAQSTQAVAIMRWVQQNITYTLDPDGWDVYQDHEYTLATLRGDCAAQTIMLIGMLRSIGIEAFALYVDHGEGIDHVCVVAETMDAGRITLDPIALWQLPGALPGGTLYEYRPHTGVVRLS